MQPREPGLCCPAYWHGKVGVSQGTAVVMLWAGTECTYTAWAQAGACPELPPSLSPYILTFPPNQSPGTPSCSVAGMMVGGSREKHVL